MCENMEYPEKQENPANETQRQAEPVSEGYRPYHANEQQSYQANGQADYQASYRVNELPHYQSQGYAQWGGYQSAPYQQPQTPPTPHKPKKEKKGMRSGAVIALALCCAILGGAMGFGGALLGNYLGTGGKSPANGNTSVVYEGQRETNVINTVRVDTDELKTAAEVYAENVNSTVGITTSITTNYWGYQTTSAASGSGFILTEDGYLLTNYHVVEGSNSIKATMYDGTAYDAKLIGYDASNDIAVLKIDAQGLTPVVLGNSENLNVGDPVVAIGNPLGELTFSLTQGAISALDREITLSGGTTMNLLQTDCAINSGNSGGALLNAKGELVGIPTLKFMSASAGFEGLGFCIPINTVKAFLSQIIETGSVVRPRLGITVADIDGPDEPMRKYPPIGAQVFTVEPGGPSARAGLQQGDVITEVNGVRIKGYMALLKELDKCEAGDSVELKVYRYYDAEGNLTGSYEELHFSVRLEMLD